MSPDLPAALREAMARRLEGVARTPLASRAQVVSAHYRKGGSSAAVVAGADDALAYALTRLPATYAAGAAVLAEARRMAPEFRPRTLTDVGAGPGGAGWAALAVWPEIGEATLVDSNAAFLVLASELAAAGPLPLAKARRLRADLTQAAPPPGDLVLVSYALAELAPAAQAPAIRDLWAATRGLLVLIEPGTPAGFERLRTARRQLIAAGARIAAPCPHEAECPLVGGDWCHFSQRLPRSRDHRLAKGAEAPFEDEKYAYLVAARPEVDLLERSPRVLARPRSGKPGIELKLCGPDGVESRLVPRRDKPAHARARRLGWGDALGERLPSPAAKPGGRG